MNIHTYAKAIKNRYSLTEPLSGLSGRIIRGKKPADFFTLTDDPLRKIVLLVGEDGLAKLPGRTGYEMLVEIGYKEDYIARKVSEGNHFKLVVFPEGGPAKLATWDNVVDVVSEVYPLAETKLRFWKPSLKYFIFQQLQLFSEFNFDAVDKAGPSDPRYMTYERFIKSPQSLVDTRAFLYFTVHLRELFSGDGYTYTHTGERGLKEYLIANKPLAQLGDYELIDLSINLPN